MECYQLTMNNSSGALARVITLITGRRWQLESLHWPPAESPDRRVLLLQIDSGGRSGQVEAQLKKLYDVLAVCRVP